LTGWWQVNGRSDKPMHLHTEEDLYYIQHYSIWLDLQILARTVWVVLRKKGAF
jgi:lipopolysaccharide/colanic/teichoic acid biosynthesis glycosyltransferase